MESTQKDLLMITKTLSVAQYMLNYHHRAFKDKTISKDKLSFLMYSAHGYTLGFGNLRWLILGEDIIATKDGIQFSSLGEFCANMDSTQLENLTIVSDIPFLFKANEKSIMDQVVDAYGKWSDFNLRAFCTQEGSPWYETMEYIKERSQKPQKPQNKPATISNDLTMDWFRQILKEAGLYQQK